NSQLVQIQDQNLQLGNNTGYTGNISLGAAIHVGAAAAGTAAGSYNLSLLTGGRVITGANGITTNTNNLTINATGSSPSVSVDAISASSGNVSLTGQNGVTLGNTVTITGAGNLTVSAPGGSITSNAISLAGGTLSLSS